MWGLGEVGKKKSAKKCEKMQESARRRPVTRDPWAEDRRQRTEDGCS